MKQELFEYIIRSCIKEVLKQVNEEGEKTICPKCKGKGYHSAELKNLGTLDTVHHTAVPCDFPGCHNGVVDHDENLRIIRGIKEEEDTKGAPAPPADGLGTADQPEIPKEEEPEIEEPKEPELSGVVFVNPKDKSKLQKVNITGNDASIERNLHSIASTMAGSKVKIAISAMRMVKDAINNPSVPVYLYIGKYDPQSSEVFLMADKSLQVAKDASVDSNEISAEPAYVSNISNPTDIDIYRRMASGGRTHVSSPINENLKSIIKKMVNEFLDYK